MKKSLPVALFLTLALAGCGEESTTSEDQVNTQTSQSISNENSSSNNSGIENNTSQSTNTTTSYAEAYKVDVPWITEETAELQQQSYDFIENNSELIPANDETAITSVKTRAESIDIKLLNKNLAPYYEQFVKYEGYVIQIEEQNLEDGEILSWLNIYDEINNVNHNVLIYKSTGDILEEDYVTFWGVPLTKYSYETLDGGYQNTILYAGSHIEKE